MGARADSRDEVQPQLTSWTQLARLRRRLDRTERCALRTISFGGLPAIRLAGRGERHAAVESGVSCFASGVEVRSAKSPFGAGLGEWKMSAMQMLMDIGQLGLLALAMEPGVRVGGRSMGVVAARLTMEVTLAARRKKRLRRQLRECCCSRVARPIAGLRRWGEISDLIVRLDNATGATYLAFLVEKEGVMSSFLGLAETVDRTDDVVSQVA
jgi:hypothetical protein